VEEKYLLSLFLFVVALSFLFSGNNLSGAYIGDYCRNNGETVLIEEFSTNLGYGSYKVCENNIWEPRNCSPGESAQTVRGEIYCGLQSTNPRSSYGS